MESRARETNFPAIPPERKNQIMNTLTAEEMHLIAGGEGGEGGELNVTIPPTDYTPPPPPPFDPYDASQGYPPGTTYYQA